MGFIKKQLVKYPTRTVCLSFVFVILAGSFLLALPGSVKKDGISFLDHLFIAVSATCVTGLAPFPIREVYTTFGHVVILLMIQIGGLGFMTILATFLLLLKRRLSFSSRLLIQEALNRSNMDHLFTFLKFILKYTMLCEGVGTLCLFPVFLKSYAPGDAFWFAVFHSVSAFCNAGFDIIGSQSLIPYAGNTWLLTVIAALIILGGIGFAVALEIYERVIRYLTSPDTIRKSLRQLSLHTKLVVITTVLLIFGGAALVYVFEKDNPGTLGNLSFKDQIAGAFFQSVTYRTAGFASFDQSRLTSISKLLGCLFMFIGGSPAGTAGGVKTITLAVLLLCIRAVAAGRRQVVAFGRAISFDTILRVLALFAISFGLVFVAGLGLCIIEDAAMIDLFYEAFSAFATVGLSANLTATLSALSKAIVMFLMYIGRVGPISMILSFMAKSRGNVQNDLTYPDADIMVG